MNPRTQTRTLLAAAAILLLGIGACAAWLGRDILNPIRTVTLTSSGASILTTPRAFFKTPAVVGTVGQPMSLPVYIDSNGGSLAEITAQLQYNPADMNVDLGASPDSVCRQYTQRDHDEVSGLFTVTCTAPTALGGQITPFVSFTVTPRHAGGLPVELIGRTNDYGVITAQ